MATRYHDLDDERGRQAIEFNGWFVGFVEPDGKCWRAYDPDEKPIAEECLSRVEAAYRCWNERPTHLVKMSRLLELMNRETTEAGEKPATGRRKKSPDRRQANLLLPMTGGKEAGAEKVERPAEAKKPARKR